MKKVFKDISYALGLILYKVVSQHDNNILYFYKSDKIGNVIVVWNHEESRI